MRYLTLAEVLELHRLVVEQTGGSAAVRDLGALQSVVAQPRASFEGRDLYPSPEAKASALCFSIILGHPFIDGNKRTGHAALETFLVLNGLELEASVEGCFDRGNEPGVEGSCCNGEHRVTGLRIKPACGRQA